MWVDVCTLYVTTAHSQSNPRRGKLGIPMRDGRLEFGTCAYRCRVPGYSSTRFALHRTHYKVQKCLWTEFPARLGLSSYVFYIKMFNSTCCIDKIGRLGYLNSCLSATIILSICKQSSTTPTTLHAVERVKPIHSQRSVELRQT